jgi:hypothetical protein
VHGGEEKVLKRGKRRAREEKGWKRRDFLVEVSRSGGWATDHRPSMTQSFYHILVTASPPSGSAPSRVPDTAPRTPQNTALLTALVRWLLLQHTALCCGHGGRDRDVVQEN